MLGLPLALVAITFYVYLPKFYADVAELNLAVIGVIVLWSRIWDACTDPVIGYLSDRTRSRWGRRRVWIVAASIPLAISFLALVFPSWRGESFTPAWWFAVWTFLFFLFWTMVTVPYEALGAELSFDYNERTTVLSFREGAVVLGSLLAAVFPFLYQRLWPHAPNGEAIAALGIFYAVLTILCAAMCAWSTKENVLRDEQRPTANPIRNFRNVLSNKPFRVLLLAYVISAFGGALPATLILFYTEDVLHTNQGSAFLVLYFLVGFLFLPAWVALANKIGKKEAWLAAMTVNTGAFCGVFFLGNGDLILFGVLVGISAVGYGASFALPASMQADVIDLDELTYGTRKEGQFIGLWAIAKKLSAALGAGIGLVVLHWAGYQEGAQSQNEDALLALRMLYAGIPCVCNIASIIIAWRFPIDRNTFEDIRKQIACRA